MYITNKSANKKSCSNMETRDDKPGKKRQTRSSKQSVPSNSKVMKSQLMENPLKYKGKSLKTLSHKRPMALISGPEIFRKLPKTMKSVEFESDTPNHTTKSLECLSENPLISNDSACSNKETSDLITVETSAVVNGIPEKDTDNEIPLHTTNLSCQPLERLNEEKLTTEHTNCPDQEPQEAVLEKCYKFNGKYERPGAQNSMKNTNTTNTVSQFDRPSNHSDQDQCYLPYAEYLYPDPHFQEILAQRSTEVRGIDLSYWPPGNAINLCAVCNSKNLSSCSSIHSHEYESSMRYEDFLTLDPSLQNRLVYKANGVDETAYLQSSEKNMQTYPNLARQSFPASEGSHRKTFLTANVPSWRYPNEMEIFVGRSMNTNDDHRIYPEIITKCIPCAPQNIMNQYSLSPHHVHGYQSSTINRNDSQQRLLTQDLNRIEQTNWSVPSPRTHNVYETLDGGHDANTINQRTRTQSTATRRLDVLEGTQLYNPVKIIDNSVPKEKSMDSKAFLTCTTDNIPFAMQNVTSSSNHSCCSSNSSNRKQVSPIVNINSYQDPRMRETLAEGSNNVNRIDQRARNHSTLNNVPPVLVGWVVHDPVKIMDEIVLKENPMDSRAFLTNTTDKIPSAERNFSPNHSCCSFNCLTRQQVSQFVRNNSYLDPCMKETLVGESNDAKSADQRARMQSIATRRLNVLEGTQLYDPVKIIDERVPIEIYMDPRACHPNTTDNIPSPVRNCSSSFNQSCCTSNCFNRKQVSPVVKNNSYQDSRMQETLVERSTQTHYTMESVYARKDIENRPSTIHNPSKINQSTMLLRQYRFSPIQKKTLVESSIEKRNVGIGTRRIKNVNHCRQSTLSETHNENKSIVTQNLPNYDHEFLDANAVAEQALLKVFREVLEKLQLSVPNLSSIFDDIRTTSIDMHEMTQKVMKTIDQYCELKKISDDAKDTPIKPKTKTERNINVKINYNNDDDDGAGDNYEGSKEKRQKRQFILPPEYEPNNTKWTLKHQKAGPGIVELITYSRIYINKIKFEHCKRVARDYKTLARMLMMEIFSLNALSVCSLTGAKANAFDIDGSNVRPGLDEYARIVLLMFVEEHGRSKGWGPFYSHCVLSSIRSKIQDIRAKYG